MAIYESIYLRCEHCRLSCSHGVMTTFVWEGCRWAVHVGCKAVVESGEEKFRDRWDETRRRFPPVVNVAVQGEIL